MEHFSISPIVALQLTPPPSFAGGCRIASSYRISSAADLQAWSALHCWGRALSVLLLAESFLPNKHSKATFAQRPTLCFRWERDLVRANPDQVVPFISFCVGKAREKGNDTSPSVGRTDGWPEHSYVFATGGSGSSLRFCIFQGQFCPLWLGEEGCIPSSIQSTSP